MTQDGHSNGGDGCVGNAERQLCLLQSHIAKRGFKFKELNDVQPPDTA